MYTYEHTYIYTYIHVYKNTHTLHKYSQLYTHYEVGLGSIMTLIVLL